MLKLDTNSKAYSDAKQSFAPQQHPWYVPPGPDEAERVAALHSYRVMDTTVEGRFERFADLLKLYFHPNIWSVGFVGEDKVLAKAGTNAGMMHDRHMSVSPLALTIPLSEQLLEVKDPEADNRLSVHPLVTVHKMKWFVTCPLRSPAGYTIGSITLIDTRERSLDDDGRRFLAQLSGMIMEELELRLKAVRFENEVNERATANTELADEKNLLLYALACSSEGLVMLRRGLTISYANDGFARMARSTQDAVIGQSLARFVPVAMSSGDQSPSGISKAVYMREEVDQEIEFRRSDGTMIWAQLRLNFLVEADCCFGVLSDITERKNREQELQRAIATAEKSKAEAEVASQSKSNFLTNMSHELRTPLHGVMGCVQVMARSQMTQQQRKWLGTIQKSCSVLSSIINDLLDMSKITHSKISLELQPIDLPTLLEEVLEINISTAIERNLDLGLFLPNRCLVPVMGDKSRIQRVIMNFVGNAVKFTEKGAIVVRVSMEAEDDVNVTMRFAVSDTGIGIRQEDYDRLFKRFSQIDDRPTRNFGGTGLGLALCKELAELMGGRIGVDSQVGKGSTFWFTAVLPRIAPRERSRLTSSPSNPSLANTNASLVNTSSSMTSTVSGDSLRIRVEQQERSPRLSPLIPPGAPVYLQRALSLQRQASKGYTLSHDTVITTGQRLVAAMEDTECVVVHAQESVRQLVIDYFAEGDCMCWGAADPKSAWDAICANLVLTEQPTKPPRVHDPDLDDIGADSDEDISPLSSTPMGVVLIDDHPAWASARDALVTRIRARADLAHVVVVLMTARGLEGAHHYNALLNKPVTRTSLATALESLHPDEEEEYDPFDSSPVRVLAADDDATNRMIMEEMLDQWPRLALTLATNGAEVLHEFRVSLSGQAFKIGLLDVQMPVMSGLEACKGIRALEALNNRPAMPLIALTGGASAEEVSQCMAAGFTAVLHKPFSLEDLQRVLSQHVPQVPAPAASEEAPAGNSSNTVLADTVIQVRNPPQAGLDSTKLSVAITAAAAAAAAVAAPTTPLGPMLLVVGNPIKGMLLSQLLTMEGHRIINTTVADLALHAEGAGAVFVDAEAPDAAATIDACARLLPNAVVGLSDSETRDEALFRGPVPVVALRVPFSQDSLRAALRTVQLRRGGPGLGRGDSAPVLETDGESVTKVSLLSRADSQPGLMGAAAGAGSGAKRPKKKPAPVIEEEVDPVSLLLGSAREALESRLPKLRVLVVDDNPINVMMMLQFLEYAGITTTATAENGQIAVDRVADGLRAGNPFRVCLMDCSMPVCDGYEATTRVRTLEHETGVQPMPIIAVTAHNDTADRERCFARGMNDYMGKPYDAITLYKIVGPWIRPILEAME